MQTPLRFWMILLFAAIGLIPATLPAQGKAPDDRRVWVIMASAPDQVTKTSRIFSGENSVAIPRSKRGVSTPLAIAKNNIISIAKVSENHQPEKTWLSISIAEEIDRALIILIPKKNKDGDWKLRSEVWDLASFVQGDWLFLNLTTSTFRVVENGESIEIAPDSDGLSKSPSKGKTPTSVSISFEYLKKDHDAWTSLSSSSVVRHPTRREICIFTENAKTNAIDYHGLTFIAK